MRAMVKPGEYVLWVVLYDRKTGRHNVARRRIQVREIGNDPLPFAYMSLPLVEYPANRRNRERDIRASDNGAEPARREQATLEVNVISTLSPPEQWTARARLFNATPRISRERSTRSLRLKSAKARCR